MKAYLAIALGLAMILAPLWTLSGFVTVPEYRTGTIDDYSNALISGATLYGGVLVGVVLGRRFHGRQRSASHFKRTFITGMAGAMGAITLALIIAFLMKLVSTGQLMPEGQSPALLPIFYIVGGLLSAFIAAGAGLIAYGLSSEAKGEEPE